MAYEYNDIDWYLGKKLRSARKLAGFTQSQLAEKIGVAFQTVQKYENGVMRVSASRLYSVSEALNIPLSFFFEGLAERIGAPPASTMQHVIVLSELPPAKSECVRLIADAPDDVVGPLISLLQKLANESASDRADMVSAAKLSVKSS